MKRVVLLLVLVFVLTSIIAAEVRKDSSGRDLYVTDRIKIKLNQEASETINALLKNNDSFEQTGLETIDALNLEYGVKKIILAHRPVNDKAWEQQNGFNRWYLFFVSEKTNIEKAVLQYSENKYVEHANPEYLYYLSVTPSDPYFQDCWGHDNTSTNGPGSGHTVGFDSHIEQAWDDDQGYGSSSVVIAIIDTGTDYNHLDLNNNCVAGYDYGDNDNDPMDDSADEGHGTCCAGVAAGDVNNGIGVSGVAGGCSIMPLKVANSAGSLTFTAIDNALTHCGDNNVDVASMSFGADMSQGNSPSTDAAISYAYSNGVTMLAATANNDYSHTHFPSNHEYVIAVGAASPCEERKRASSCDAQNWWGSNYGLDIQDDRASVDIIAPTILPATDVTGINGYSTGDYITNFNGTSCATPYAAGVAALIKSKNPLLTPAEIRAILTSTATDVIDEQTTPGWDRYTGYGMVNADAAVAAVSSSGFPTCNITNPADDEVINTGDVITIMVDANDPSRSVSNVKIYIDNALKTTDYSAPYQFIWNTTGETIDYHAIKATAIDNESNETDHEITVRIAYPTFTIFDDDFETANGWTLTGEFQRGIPTGLGGNYGNPDPTYAHGGSYVLGVDLSGLGSYNGDYEVNLGDRAYTAISPVIDCSAYINIELNFWRWLNVESPSFDHAYIDAYDGSSWHEVWTNSALVGDNSWNDINADISAYADGNSNFRLRFSIGPTDSSWQYSGWNIDDLVITGEGSSPTPTITVTAPNGGEDWQLGSTHNITWASQNTGANVKINLYNTGSYYNTIISSTADDGTFIWNIPTGNVAGTQYTVKIEDTTDPAIYDYSDANFTLSEIPVPIITVTSPNGGEDWQLNSVHNITWTSANTSSNVKIELFDNGIFYNTISSSTTDDGTFSWAIPNTYDAGSLYRIRITDVNATSVSDFSNANFILSLAPEADIIYTPSSFSKDLLPDTSTTDDLVIGNIGTAALNYTATVSYNARVTTNYASEFEGMKSKTKIIPLHNKKTLIQYDPSNYPNPRQGGDNVGNALVIGSLPYSDTGTTSGYADDYDEVCPYTGSTSPDVVYSYTPSSNEIANITLCNGSSYDTKLYVYENVVTSGNPFACDDDTCPGYVSELIGMSFTGGNTYYIILDGYGGDSGSYVIDVTSDGGGSSGYCESTYSDSGSGADDWIANVTFGTINNTTSYNDPNSYGDYTGISTDIEQNSTYPLCVTLGFDGSFYTEHVRVWFDWNQDLDFTDAGESFYIGIAPNDGTYQICEDILVPADAILGSTRMRVIEQYNTDPDGYSCSPHTTTFGETEDYTVNVIEGGTPPENWLTVNGINEVTNTISSGGANDNIIVSFDAAGLLEGTHNATITIVSNDPDEPTVNIPVSLNVSGQPEAPVNVVIQIAGSDIQLSWDVVNGASKYHVFRSTDPLGSFDRITPYPSGITTNSYIDTPSRGEKHFYYITAE